MTTSEKYFKSLIFLQIKKLLKVNRSIKTNSTDELKSHLIEK